MQQTSNYALKKIELADSPPDITVINPNWDTIDEELNSLAVGKVDKVTGKGLSTEDYTTAEKNKLAGIAAGANKYTHPSTHAPSIIAQDADNRFVTDAEKIAWNAKAGADVIIDTQRKLRMGAM